MDRLIELKGGKKLSLEKVHQLVGKINGIIYARVSTTDQAKKGYSLTSQKQLCIELAKTKFHYTEDELITIIEDGRMGDDPNRPGLNYVLYLLEQGVGKKLIMLHPDRLTRDNTLQGIISRKVWSMGVDIEFVEFDVNPNDPESMLMYNIQGSIAQYNKAKILANARRGRIAKAKKGEIPNFRRLYGYHYNKQLKTVDINMEEKSTYLKMVDMLLQQKMSCNQIAQTLSQKGIEGPNGSIWYQSTVTRILRNESYTGRYYYGKTKVVQKNGKKEQIPRPKEEWILIEIPRIIDDMTYDRIQQAIDQFRTKQGRKSNDYLLSRIVICGRCHGAVGAGVTSKSKQRILKYYVCRKKQSKGYKVGSAESVHHCKGKNWRVDIVDSLVWNWCKHKMLQMDTVNESVIKTMYKLEEDTMNWKKEIDSIKKRVTQLQKERSNYVKLFVKEKISELYFDECVQQIDKRINNYLDKKRYIYEKNIKKGKVSEEEYIHENRLYIQTLIKHTLTPEEKRRAINIFVKQVILYDDDTIEIIPR